MPVDIESLGSFDSGTTVRFFAIVVAVSGSVRQTVTPSSFVAQIFSGSSRMSSGSVSLSDDGKSYYYDYTIPLTANRKNWYIEFDAIVSGKPIVKRRVFEPVMIGT